MNANQLIGIIIVIFGLIWLIYGDREIKESGKEGIVYRWLCQRKSKLGISLLKWVGGTVLVFIGMGFIFGWVK